MKDIIAPLQSVLTFYLVLFSLKYRLRKLSDAWSRKVGLDTDAVDQMSNTSDDSCQRLVKWLSIGSTVVAVLYERGEEILSSSENIPYHVLVHRGLSRLFLSPCEFYTQYLKFSSLKKRI